MAALSATLALILGNDAHARDRYRCFPAGGGESYTVTGSCRSQADSRAPLSAQEVTELETLQNNGRRFVRCTAADGSYSFFLPDGTRPCPAASDIRTNEYAVKGQSSRAVAPSQPVVPVVASPPPAPVPVLAPVAPAVSPAAAPPAARTDSQETNSAVKVFLMILAGLGIAWAVRAYATRPGREATGRRPERSQATPKQRNDVAEEMKSLHRRPEAKGMDMQQKAQEFLAALRAGTDVPGGLAFLEDLLTSP